MFSRLNSPGGDPRVSPKLAGGIKYLIWSGKDSEHLRRKWGKKYLGEKLNRYFLAYTSTTVNQP